MLAALFIMILGIGVGWLLRRCGSRGADGAVSSRGAAQWIRKRIAMILLITVCLLLFIMGLRVATDPMITQNLYKIGAVALVIFICVALGTLLAIRLSTRFIDHKAVDNSCKESVKR